MLKEQYEVKWKDYYSTLGVNATAEAEVFKAAYAAMAKKYHPDRGGTTERMKEINEAYEVLSDTGKKARYDAFTKQKQATSHASSYNYSTRSSSTRSGYSSNGGNYYQSYSYGYQNNQRTKYSNPYKETNTSALREKILPWPSWKWQRIALFCSIPVGLLLLSATYHGTITIIGFLLLSASCYACIKTKCLIRVKQANSAAKFAGGSAILVGLCAMLLLAVLLVIPFAIPAALVFAFLPGGTD